MAGPYHLPRACLLLDQLCRMPVHPLREHTPVRPMSEQAL